MAEHLPQPGAGPFDPNQAPPTILTSQEEVAAWRAQLRGGPGPRDWSPKGMAGMTPLDALVEQGRPYIEGRQNAPAEQQPVTLGPLNRRELEFLDLKARSKDPERQELLKDALNGDTLSKLMLDREDAVKGPSRGWTLGIGRTPRYHGKSVEAIDKKIAPQIQKDEELEAERRTSDEYRRAENEHREAQGLPPVENPGDKKPAGRGDILDTVFRGVTPDEVKLIKMLQQNARSGHNPGYGDRINRLIAQLNQRKLVPEQWATTGKKIEPFVHSKEVDEGDDRYTQSHTNITGAGDFLVGQFQHGAPIIGRRDSSARNFNHLSYVGGWVRALGEVARRGSNRKH